MFPDQVDRDRYLICMHVVTASGLSKPHQRPVATSYGTLVKTFWVRSLQDYCSNILGAKQDFCSNILSAKMLDTKQDFCSKIWVQSGAKQDFCSKFWVWSKIFVQSCWMRSKTFVQKINAKEDICSKVLGVIIKQDFCSNFLGPKQDFCSNILDAKQDFCS